MNWSKHPLFFVVFAMGYLNGLVAGWGAAIYCATGLLSFPAPACYGTAMAATTVDEYLAGVPPAQRVVLERVRRIIQETAPDAEETLSYGMPAYMLHGQRLLYFAAYKNHLSLFGNVGALEEQLGAFSLSHKGTVRFTATHPLPDDLVKAIVLHRLAAIAER